MPLTETELAYIAGIVDGEGCIMLQKCTARASDAYIYPVVKVANTDFRLMDWLVKKIGAGAVQYRTRSNTGCKDVQHWTIASNQAIQFLKTIRPYLIVKAHQADVALAVWEENAAALELTGRKQFGHGNCVPAWLRNFRTACYWYVRDLNRRGPGGFRFGNEVRALLAKGV
jgi:hypothetical protein